MKPLPLRTCPALASLRIHSGGLLVLLTALCLGSASFAQGLDSLGHSYRLIELDTPRPNRVHVLRLDLAGGRIAPAVVLGADPDGEGPAEAALTDPFVLAADSSVIAFVNTNPWDSLPDSLGRKQRLWYPGQPVDIMGLAAAGGDVQSPVGGNGASVWFDASGALHMGAVPDSARIQEGLAGFQQILVEGKVSVGPAGAIHPRTALCAGPDGRDMWLVVVDGRQEGFSEGMALDELAETMRGLGCWNAMNLDGGGSSVMALRTDGRLEVVNSPSDRWFGEVRIRPIPSVLTIQRR